MKKEVPPEECLMRELIRGVGVPDDDVVVLGRGMDPAPEFEMINVRVTLREIIQGQTDS